jgi:hypothetical protein
VLFLAVGLVMTRHAIVTPMMVKISMVTSNFFAMSVSDPPRADAPRALRSYGVSALKTSITNVRVCKASISTPRRCCRPPRRTQDRRVPSARQRASDYRYAKYWTRRGLRAATPVCEQSRHVSKPEAWGPFIRFPFPDYTEQITCTVGPPADLLTERLRSGAGTFRMHLLSGSSLGMPPTLRMLSQRVRRFCFGSVLRMRKMSVALSDSSCRRIELCRRP